MMVAREGSRTGRGGELAAFRPGENFPTPGLEIAMRSKKLTNSLSWPSWVGAQENINPRHGGQGCVIFKGETDFCD